MPANKTKELTNTQRQEIANFLLKNSTNGKLKRGLIKAAKIEFGRSILTISKLWKKVKVQLNQGSHVINVQNRKSLCGRKKKDRHNVMDRIKQVPWIQRQTLRSLSNAVNIPKSSLHRMLKNGDIHRAHTSLKPLLNAQNRENRRLYCLSMIRKISTR